MLNIRDLFTWEPISHQPDSPAVLEHLHFPDGTDLERLSAGMRNDPVSSEYHVNHPIIE
jgi:hypothetical protein